MQLAWLPDSLTFDARDMVDLTLLWGLDSVVLRHVGSSSGRVPSINEGPTRDRLRDAEIGVAAIDPGIFEGDLRDRAGWLNEISSVEAAFSFCSRLACPLIQVSAFVRSDGTETEDLVGPFRQLLGRSPGDIAMAVKNEIWSHVTGAKGLLALIDRVEHPLIRASWCPATSYVAGQNPAEVAAQLMPRLSIVRCSDVRGTRTVPFGTGEVPWARVLATLARSEYDGVLSLELPVSATRKEGLRAATALISAWRSACTTERRAP